MSLAGDDAKEVCADAGSDQAADTKMRTPSRVAMRIEAAIP
jgi:hypothetical protein